MTSPPDVSQPKKTPGTWAVETGDAVEWSDALSAWSAVARATLSEVAGTYHKVITYQELAAAVQSGTGIRTRSLLTNWIGKVLEAVALDCRERSDVLLTALCVRQDGTVGAGFSSAASHFCNGEKPADPEVYAADVRLACYQKYATDMPANGGHPKLTPQESARRRAAAPEPKPKLCPIHFTVLPLSGQCDDCANA